MPPTIEISTGRLAGIEQNGLHCFRGIPFAAPPIGARRLRPPAPPAAWAGVRDASAFGPTCPQPPDMVSAMLGFTAQPSSEDCLTLNVWTPGVGSARRPVLVWIHGGAFAVGSGSRGLSDATALARRGDAVVVSLNYRLGVFGFLHLADDAEPEAGTNLGLLDQVAALEWVRDNITVFGGDPDNVTIFGESAGAISVAMLLVMPRARGLFRRAILQSGSANFALPASRAALVAAAVRQALDLPTAATAEQLRALPAEALLTAETRVIMATPSGVNGLPFAPWIDGTVVPDEPFALLAGGCARDVATIVGTTLDEMKLFDVLDPKARELDEAALLRRCGRNLTGGEAMARRAVEHYRDRRAERGAAVDPPTLWTAIESDRLFRAPAMRLAAIQAAQGAPTYAYLFTWSSPYLGGALGACHALDVPIVFGTYDNPLVAPFTGSDGALRDLSHRMQDAWCAFARAGDPHHDGLPAWPRYDVPRRATMLLGAECGVVEAPYEGERAFWD